MERTITVDGRKTRYTSEGSGEPVLLLHGIGRSLEDWSLVREALAHTHTVLSLDLPGYGSSARLSGKTTLPGLAQGVLDFLDAVDERRPVTVIGNSLGGAVAMQLAALMPHRVAALVLVDSAGFGREVTAALRIFAVPVVGRRLARPSRNSAELETKGIFYDRSMVTEERITFAHSLAQRPGGTDVLLETAHALGTLRGVKPQWRRALLAELAAHDIPMLIVWGEKDLILPAHHLDAAMIAFPNARSHVFPKTGHMPQLERPAEFLELVTEFLRETAIGGTAIGENA